MGCPSEDSVCATQRRMMENGRGYLSQPNLSSADLMNKQVRRRRRQRRHDEYGSMSYYYPVVEVLMLQPIRRLPMMGTFHHSSFSRPLDGGGFLAWCPLHRQRRRLVTIMTAVVSKAAMNAPSDTISQLLNFVFQTDHDWNCYSLENRSHEHISTGTALVNIDGDRNVEMKPPKQLETEYLVDSPPLLRWREGRAEEARGIRATMKTFRQVYPDRATTDRVRWKLKYFIRYDHAGPIKNVKNPMYNLPCAHAPDGIKEGNAWYPRDSFSPDSGRSTPPAYSIPPIDKTIPDYAGKKVREYIVDAGTAMDLANRYVVRSRRTIRSSRNRTS